jgi:phosphohistidine phosphatase SixA
VKRSMRVKFFIVLAAAKLLVGFVSPALAQASTDLAPLVILVRHAEKACTNSDDPPLSQAGKKRAEALAAALASAGVGRVITTDFRRTNETAGPLAQALALQPVVINLKNGPTDLPAHIGRVVDAARASNDGAVLVVGHTVTIPGMITGLGGPEMGEISESEYSNLFVLVGGPKIRVVRSHYGAPDHNSQPDCN